MGFRRLNDIVEWRNECSHPEHDPPGMIVLRPGRYEWTCPGCGAKQIVEVQPRLFWRACRPNLIGGCLTHNNKDVGPDGMCAEGRTLRR